MSFTFKGGQAVQPGEEVRVPIPSSEPSVLDVDWSVEGDQELHFVVEFAKEPGAEPEVLLSEENCAGKKVSALEVASAGTCSLVFKNCYYGFFGGSVRKTTYSVSLTSVEERRRQEEEEQQRQAALEAEERRKAEAVEKAKRLVSIEDDIRNTEELVQTTQKAAEEKGLSVAAQRQEVEAVREKLAALEEAFAKEEAVLKTRVQERENAATKLTQLRSEKTELETHLKANPPPSTEPTDEVKENSGKVEEANDNSKAEQAAVAGA